MRRASISPKVSAATAAILLLKPIFIPALSYEVDLCRSSVRLANHRPCWPRGTDSPYMFRPILGPSRGQVRHRCLCLADLLRRPAAAGQRRRGGPARSPRHPVASHWLRTTILSHGTMGPGPASGAGVPGCAAAGVGGALARPGTRSRPGRPCTTGGRDRCPVSRQRPPPPAAGDELVGGADEP